MDLRQLQQFVVLAETGNFHRAAERLHMAQPPLSISIRKLEADLGTPLFVRTTRGVRLTQAGESAHPETLKRKVARTRNDYRRLRLRRSSERHDQVGRSARLLVASHDAQVFDS